MFRFFLIVSCLVLSILAGTALADAEEEFNGMAETYVRLVLAIGEHDAGYVDAYYGPEEWREEAKTAHMDVDGIKRLAQELLGEVNAVTVSSDDEMLVLRQQFLARTLEAMIAYVEALGGKKMSFDDESAALFDAVAPTHDTEYFEQAIARLDEVLPGEGPVVDRYNAFRENFFIPKEKLDEVFQTAIVECRSRTMKHIDLPDDEQFEIEYVTDKPWSGYNWYKGSNRSLIQVNTDFPISVSRAIDLACHEGYPGHHVYNVLLESRLVRDRGWVEFTVYPLFSPMSLIAEGSANFGIEVTFPNDERVKYEREVLFPLAGLDPDKAELFYEVEGLLDRVSYAGNEAARKYLDGVFDREQAVKWLVSYALMTERRAEQRVDFIDTYRSYVINYNLGKDLVRAYVEAQGGTASNPEKRWEEFTALISSPRLPSGLR